MEFVKGAWHVLEPGREFHSGWHLDAICEHLTAVSNGQIRNLLINMPPRHMKSLAVSVFWPVWVWLTNPITRWLYSSYALSLSIRDSLKCRRLITSPWFQERWGSEFNVSDPAFVGVTDDERAGIEQMMRAPEAFQIVSDQNAKMRFDNDRTGYRIATSVGGAATGEGGDIVVVDDPHNVQEKESEAIREATLTWWNETMSTRLNDPKTGSKVIVMQRVHEADLSGLVLKQGGYVHLCLPAEFEPKRKCITQIGWEDPRTTAGELLWPNRVGPAELAEFRTRLGPSAFAGQFQQTPAPAGGNLFRFEWFEIVDAAPPLKRSARGWDLAATEPEGTSDPDWTAGAKIGQGFDNCYYITDARRDRLSPAKVEAFVQTTAAQDGRDVEIRMEQEPGSSGKAQLANYTNKVLAGYAVRGYPSTGDKVTRANPFSATCERRVVKLVRGAWNDAFLSELCMFPNAAHDDWVDAVVNAFTALHEGMELAKVSTSAFGVFK